jgi:hypothetical protein
MTRSHLLAQLMTFDHPNAAQLDQCVGGDWRPVMQDLIFLDCVRRTQIDGGRKVFRVVGWHPTASNRLASPDSISMKGRGMLRKQPGYATQIQAAYREWRLYA